MDSASVHPREIYKFALLTSAAAIIFVHSHPSGDPDPSESDKKITDQLVKAGELMGIEVLDHVIISRDGYYSYSDNEFDFPSRGGGMNE